ncbi:hypothetical protein RJ639_010677 [Escallonia herrerae]|uniref:Uncharacterized protein n=1 Tax=Escallonia herrerae TaxID=1293975 RepID=A0AA88VPS7_9ASTE|nr:hypothetical protein RJ639_010677 [Escallonia herrerae]
MAIVQRLEDFKKGEKLRSPRHERAKDRGDGRSKNGSPKSTDDEWSRDEGRRRHHKEDKKHEGSRKQGDSRDHKAHGGLRKACFYCAGLHCGSDREARMGTLKMVNAIVQKSKEEPANEKKSKERWGLLYATVDVTEKTQEALVDTRATHNFMSPKVAEWLGLKPTKDGSWFTTMNTEERPMKGVVKNVDLRTDGWTWKADFNIIDMDELGVVLGMDFMEK